MIIFLVFLHSLGVFEYGGHFEGTFMTLRCCELQYWNTINVTALHPQSHTCVQSQSATHGSSVSPFGW